MPSNQYSSRRTLQNYPLWSNPPLLPHLDIELTERCNNDCIHCCINQPENDKKVKERELNTDEWKGILRQAADLGALSVRFTGGEPLLREDFEELYLYARRLGLKVLLYTNARLMTLGLADLLARIPPLEKIEVTVYGLRAESYEAVSRRPGSFAEFRKGINLLLEKKVPFVVKGALLPPNRDEVAEFDAWAAQIPWMDHPPAYALNLELRGRRDSEEKNRRIRELRLSPREALTVMARNKESYERDMAEFCKNFLETPSDQLFYCGAGRGGAVDAYGFYQVCLSLRDPALAYDLRRGSLKDALSSHFPKLREMKAGNPEYLNRCAVCSLRGLCNQCPARSWSEHGTLDSPVEYLCEMAHEQAWDLGVLERGKMGWENK
jgi:radical SAM protein with 4Fe4S-binding SPASM domain